MKEYNLNITFPNKAECDKWEEEHIVDGRYYNGECVLMVAHDSEMGSDEITLTKILTV